MIGQTHGGKGSADRGNSKKFSDNYGKVDNSKMVKTSGFKLTVNGKEVDKDESETAN